MSILGIILSILAGGAFVLVVSLAWNKLEHKRIAQIMFNIAVFALLSATPFFISYDGSKGNYYWLAAFSAMAFAAIAMIAYTVAHFSWGNILASLLFSTLLIINCLERFTFYLTNYESTYITLVNPIAIAILVKSFDLFFNKTTHQK